jgi:hypothetical protein
LSQYRFERLSANNLGDLLILYADAFKVSVELSYLEKKYNTKPLGAQWIGFIAYDVDDYPAAYYGVFPIRVMMNNTVVLAAQSGDTMTHSKHRKKGLFIHLAQKTFELAKEEGIQFIFGFPNENSLPGFLKLGWKISHDLNLYRLNVSTIPLSKIAKKFNLFKKPYAKLCNVILNKYKLKNQFPFSSHDSSDYYVLHDSLFFDYKAYYDRYLLRLKHGLAWIKFDGRIQVGDIQCKSDDDFNRLIKQIKWLAFWCGASQIDFHVSPNSSWDHKMNKISAPMKGLRASYFDLGSNLPIDKVLFTLSDADTF